MAIKNLLSQSIFQAKKLKEASAQTVKDNLLSELTKDLKKRIRQEEQEIPEEDDEITEEEQILNDQENDLPTSEEEQENPITEDQDILPDNNQEKQQNNEESELDDIIQELEDQEEEVPQIPNQDTLSEENQEQMDDEELMERIREILESEQEQIPSDQSKDEVIDECGEQEKNKVPQEVIQSFKKKVRQLTRQNLQYKKAITAIKKELNETKCLQLKGKYALNIFNKFNLTKAQKMKIIENFDRAKNEREIKLVYATLMQGLNSPSTKKSQKTPASKAGASRKINSTKTNIKENRDLTETQNSLDAVARVFKKRAGIF